MENEAIKIFIAYARKDSRMLDELRKQFNPLEMSGKVKVWYDGQIKPGEKWDEKIQDELKSAEIILLLVSPDSISSKYFYESEVQKAIDRHENGETKVIPVILRPCLWQETPIGELQALPQNGNPIVNWSPIDSGYFDVIERVHETVNELHLHKHFAKEPDNISKAYGTIQFLDSDRIRVEYTGELFNGKATGEGVAKTLGNNPYYEYRGKYFNNLRHDKNAWIIWGIGDKYEGEYQNDRRTGKGKYFWDRGHEYTGDFLDNVYTGFGEYKTDEFFYEGEVKGLSFHKKGKLIDIKNRFTYEGEFWEGKKVGKGKIVYENGLTYEGEFLDDLPHGNGIRVLSNGVIYDGEFRKGKAHGRGRMFTNDFEIYDGIFTEDQVDSGGLMVDPTGNRFDPTEKQDSKNTFIINTSAPSVANKVPTSLLGKVTFHNGDTFEGRGWYTKDTFDGTTQTKYYLKGVYLFKHGIKLEFGDYNSKTLFFINGAKVYGNFIGIHAIGDKIFSLFNIYDIINIRSTEKYHTFSYIWPSGQLIERVKEGSWVNFLTGELFDKDGNIVEGQVIDDEKNDLFAKTKVKEEKDKPKSWWVNLLK